jgi:predicted 2-oxoglutarate/Fe(II)-dependent dioxygenase YbiX
MNTAAQLFERDKYVLLDKFLAQESCEELTLELKRLVTAGKTTADLQCPKSQSVHGALAFDSLLEQLLPNFEFACGKRLLPTYAYARLYAPGDELKIHTDRPACEISATLTLGFDGDVWPIFMGSQDKTSASKIEMGVGDAVLYRGMDVHHWRNPYTEGKWQAQVFLHYVDADGPHAEWKYDKRPKLAHHGDPDYTFWQVPDFMTPSACAKLIESLESQTTGEAAHIGAGPHGVVDKSIRDVNRVSLPQYRGIGATMAGVALSANQKAWKFDITHANQTEYLRYDIDGHYHSHIDTFFKPDDTQTRKLTVLTFLNDDFEGGRLFLQTGDKKIYPPQAAGTALIFPSFVLHGVEPVTKGIRRSIVTWMVGPWFK